MRATLAQNGIFKYRFGLGQLIMPSYLRDYTVPNRPRRKLGTVSGMVIVKKTRVLVRQWGASKPHLFPSMANGNFKAPGAR